MQKNFNLIAENSAGRGDAFFGRIRISLLSLSPDRKQEQREDGFAGIRLQTRTRISAGLEFFRKRPKKEK
jgi:hypothetical protein